MILYSFGHVRAALLRWSMRTSSVCAIQHTATYCKRQAKRFQHVVHNNVGICCFEMLRAFAGPLHIVLS